MCFLRFFNNPVCCDTGVLDVDSRVTLFSICENWDCGEEAGVGDGSGSSFFVCGPKRHWGLDVGYRVTLCSICQKRDCAEEVADVGVGDGSGCSAFVFEKEISV